MCLKMTEIIYFLLICYFPLQHTNVINLCVREKEELVSANWQPGCHSVFIQVNLVHFIDG